MIPDTLPESIDNTDSVMSSDGKIIEGIIADLRVVIDQLDMNFANAKSLILELARRLDVTKRCKQSQICRTIKEILQDKIKEGKITEKWIAECLPQEYKRRYAKRELYSLSRNAEKDAAAEELKNRDLIVVDAQSGKSVITNADSHNDGDSYDNNFLNDDKIEQELNGGVTNQNTTSDDDGKYKALLSENYELKQAVKRLTSIQTADQISATEIEFTISKAKFEEVKAAIDSSRDSVYLTFDKSGILQRADSDTFREN